MEAEPPVGVSVPQLDPASALVFDRMAERLESLLGAQPVFQVLATSPGMVEELLLLQQELGECSAALVKGDASKPLQARLDQVEADLLELDDAAPDAQVWAALAAVPEDASIHYARLLAWHLSPHRMERLVAVVTRLCQGPDGTLLPFDGVKHVLIGLGARSEVTLETLGAAVTFFEGAIQRVMALETLDALFASGFIMDVSGYRLALRNQLLEPEILYASIRLESQFRARVVALARQGGVTDQALEKRLAQANAQVDEVFKIAGRAGSSAERFVPRRARVAKTYVKPEDVFVPDAFRILSVRGLAVVVVLLAAPVSFFNLAQWMSTHLDGMPTQQLQALSPVLVEGGVSNAAPPKVFIGRVEAGRWMTLSRADRMKEARAIREKLAAQGIHTALVSRDGAIAFRVENGKIMQVE